MAKKNANSRRAKIVSVQPVFGKGRTQSGKKVRAGTFVLDDEGRATMLLTPAGKTAKAAEELRRGVRLTNLGEVKLGKNGKPQKLTKAQRAWRAGRLAQAKDSANCYNANQNNK